MTVRLEKITENNWQIAIKLPTSEDHKHFVASNLYSIAEAQFHPGVTAYGIYNEEEMVGFTMFGAQTEENTDDEETDPRFWIWRLMIAEGKRFQGFGKAALHLIIERACQSGYPEIVLSTEPNNEKAIRLYTSVGFVSTGKIEDGEEVFILNLRDLK